METEDKTLSTVGVQETDTNDFQLSGLVDIELQWENPQLDKEVVFRIGKDNLSSPMNIDNLLMGSADNFILLDEEENQQIHFNKLNV